MAIQVYVGLDIAFRQDIFESNSQTTLNEFHRTLVERVGNWIEGCTLPATPPPFSSNYRYQSIPYVLI
jgi:hypothetical protein